MSKSRYYRCGWCGLPTDSKGNPITDNDHERYVYVMDKWGRNIEKVNGKCCPQSRNIYIPESRPTRRFV